MNEFGYKIMSFINQFSQLSMTFDNTMHLSGNRLLKGGVLMCILWWLWFKNDKNRSENHIHLISTIVSSFVAIILARGLAVLLPFRLRPLHEDGLNFLLPFGMDSTHLDGWSSFPSDHAVLFFALSTGLLYTSKKAGIFAFVYTTLIICFPRVYLGLHYPTDIIAGAIIGVMIGWIGNYYFTNSKISKSILNWSLSKPQFFYPILFLLTYQIADIFGGIRSLMSMGFNIFRIILT